MRCLALYPLLKAPIIFSQCQNARKIIHPILTVIMSSATFSFIVKSHHFQLHVKSKKTIKCFYLI